jgi:hypothetical protein
MTALNAKMLDRTCIWMHVSSKCALGCELRGIYGAQELHELVTDQVGGFVLHPVADIVEFEPATRKAGAHSVQAKRIKFSQPVCLLIFSASRRPTRSPAVCSGVYKVASPGAELRP